MFGNIASALSAVLPMMQLPLQMYQSYQNLGFQKDTLNYQKDLQQQIFLREDNAVQRRVKDLRAAGLNPLLAAGSAAGSGSVVPTVAPQINPVDMLAPLLSAQNIKESELRIETSVQAIEESIARVKKMDSDITLNESAIALNAQNIKESVQRVIESGQRIDESEARIFAQTLKNQLTNAEIAKLAKNIELLQEQVLTEKQKREIEAYKFNFNLGTGFPTGTNNDLLKIIQGSYWGVKNALYYTKDNIGVPFLKALKQAMRAVGWIK